jgi:type I restriction enzyme, S subunit
MLDTHTMTSPTPQRPAQSETLLFEHFATLATAPDGIARLRELILQLAVQGKLGTQDAEDEPASVLLARIRKEKERLAKEGEIKKEKPLVSKGELAFQLPKTWICTQLGAIISFEYGESLPEIKREDSGKVPVYGSNGIVGYHSKAITKGPSLIIGRKGSAGAIQITNVPCHPIDTAYFIDNFENLDQKFIFYLLNSLKLGSLDKSTAIPGLNRNDAYNLLIGFPPLAEQHRIVAKVDRLMALCDELEARQQQERAGCLKLGTASLAGLQNAASPEEFEAQWAQVCDAFDLILDCPENVAVLRQTILQMAVQGRLSPNGDTLRWKNEPLENLVTKLTNGYVGPTRFIYVDSGIPYILSRHLKNHKIHFDGRTFISEEFNQKNRRSILQKGDVLLVQSGDIGNSAIVDDDHVGHNCHALIVMTPVKEKLEGKYLSIFFSSPEGKSQAVKIQTGMTLKHLNCRDVKEMIVPLPPLAEQRRIVAKVDALMALCDELEARLKERAAVQGKFAGAVVKQVAG